MIASISVSRAFAGVFSALAVSLSLSSVASARPITAQIVMTGLNNPRGLAVAPDGGVYVTEAGTGAFGTGNPSPASVVALSGNTEFYGATGSVSRYLNGVQSRVLSNLPSLAKSDGTEATGLQDIVFTTSGTAYGVIGSPGGPAQRTTLNNAGAATNAFGRLVRLNLPGNTTDFFADFVPVEGANNPDGGDINSNPYGLTTRAGGGLVVVDAGANALYNVAPDLTTLSLVATFAPKTNPLFNPAIPANGGPVYQSVPTAVTTGFNGAYFVSELGGYPFKQGGAQIYSVPAIGGTPTAVFSGFTTIIDLAFGADGNLYVLQLTQNGLGPEATTGPGASQLLRVNPATGEKTVLDVSLPSAPGGLLFSTGMAFAPDNSLYVSNLGTAAGGGQVVRLTGVTVPEAGTGLLALVGVGLGTALLRRRK